MHSAMKPAVFVAILTLSTGCGGSSVLMSPRMDLQAFHRIGLVEFTSNAEGDLNALASQEFIQKLQSAQPGVPVLELGNEDAVRRAIGRENIDAAAVQEIGKIYNVDAVIVGNLEVTDVKPKVGWSQLTSASVQADVEAALTTRLLEAGGGATMWTRSARAKKTVANAGINSQGVHFEASDPEAAYGSLVHHLIHDVTEDFRPYWVKQ